MPIAIATITKTIDASAVAAMLFNEPEADAVAISLENARLTAPALIKFELANICVTRIRREPHRQHDVDSLLSLIDRLNFETLEVDIAGVIELAETTGLTAYDASYLWLARSLGAELVTLDAKLARAAAEPVSPKR